MSFVAATPEELKAVDNKVEDLNKRLTVMEKFIERLDTVDVETAANIIGVKVKTMYAILKNPKSRIEYKRDGVRGIRPYMKSLMEYNLKHTVK